MTCRTTVIWSPKEGLGRTTLSAHLADRLARKGAITILLDLNRYSSALPHQFQTFSDKSLYRAYHAFQDDEILKNCAEVRGYEGLFLLCLSVHDKIDHLYRFSASRLEKIMAICRAHADRLLVIMPSNYIESGFIAALEAQAERMVVVMDEDLSNWYRLRQYGHYFSELALPLPEMITVVNRYGGQLNPARFNGLQIGSKRPVLELPEVEAVRVGRNSGRLIEKTDLLTKKERAFSLGIDKLHDFIEQAKGEEKQT